MMGILDWIKSAAANAKIKSEEREYYWVGEAHRKKCREIIQKAQRDRNVLVLPWDEWRKCMGEAKRPIESYEFAKSFRFIVRFIKELAGIQARETRIETKELPPKELPKIPKRKPHEKPKPTKIPKEKKKEEKIPKEKIPKEKIPKEKEERKKKDTMPSNLKFRFLTGRLRVNKFSLKPDFLLKFENIDEKLLEEINMITEKK